MKKKIFLFKFLKITPLTNPSQAKKLFFIVSLKGIQKNQLPELNDDFAKKLEPKDKFASLEDMKLQIRSQLEEHARGDAHREAKKIVTKKITEMNPIEVPEGLVEEQIKHMVVQALKKEQQAKNQTESINEEEIHVTDSQNKRTQRRRHPTLTTGAGT